MRYTVETLSPVHIGSGHRYSPAEFLIRAGKLIRVDINKIYQLLSEDEKDQFVDELEQPIFRMTEFLSGKQLPFTEFELYSVNLKARPPHSVNEYIKTNLKAYIPGSSLKGAIRTAVLYESIGAQEVQHVGQLFEIQNHRQRRNELKKFVTGQLAGSDRSSSYSSMLRFLQISDTTDVASPQVSIIETGSLKTTSSGWTWYSRGKGPVRTHLEVIDPQTKLNGELNLTYDKTTYRSLQLQHKEHLLTSEALKKLLFQFSDDLIDYELEFAKYYRMDFLTTFYEDLLRKNTVHTPVFKIGGGVGFLATTIGLKLKNDPTIFEKVRNSLRGQTYSYEFPKTRKVSFEEKLPLGWCRLVIE